MLNPVAAELRGENRAEPVPPQPHRLMADIDATVERQVFDNAQRQPVTEEARRKLPCSKTSNAA